MEPVRTPVCGLVGDIAHRGLDGQVRRIGARQRQIGNDSWDRPTTTGPVAERVTSCQMPMSRSRMVGIQSQPMVHMKRRPIRRGDAAVEAGAGGHGFLMGRARVRLRQDVNGQGIGGSRRDDRA